MSDDNEQMIGIFILIGLAMFAGPAALAHFGTTVSAWGLENHLLIPADGALVVIPGLNAGLDGPRAGILALVVFSAATLASLVHRGRKETKS